MEAFLGEGARIGDYRVERLIGQGGLSEVYSARHTASGRQVALKLLEPRRFGAPHILERFRREALALRNIKHPNVVVVHEAGVSERRPWIAMDLLHGVTLRERLIESGRFSPQKALALLASIFDGLEAAHREGIVHRDVKPDNIFLTEDGGLKIVDFGNAKLLDYGLRTTDPQHVFGTAGYMSPEQLASRSRVGPESDLYAAGFMLWEMLIGRHPFSRGENPEDLPPSRVLCRLQLEESPRPLHLVDSSLPKEISDFVARLTAKSPSRRPGSAFEAAQIARTLRESLLEPRRHAAPRSSPRRPIIRRNVPWAVGLGSVLGTLLFLGLLIGRSSAPPTPAVAEAREAEVMALAPPVAALSVPSIPDGAPPLEASVASAASPPPDRPRPERRALKRKAWKSSMTVASVRAPDQPALSSTPPPAVQPWAPVAEDTPPGSAPSADDEPWLPARPRTLSGAEIFSPPR